jgi:hypothetical protein
LKRRTQQRGGCTIRRALRRSQQTGGDCGRSCSEGRSANGLLAIDLSQSGKIRGDLPRRVRHNVDSGDALHRPYPREGAQLLRWIHAAWQARDQEHLIVNPRTRKTWNTPRL